jgi:hypothetical protein
MSELFAPGPAALADASGLSRAGSDVPLLDAEKLQVYRLAVM